MRTATRWSLWTLLAVIPVGCAAAAFVVARRQQSAADFEDWWRTRQRLRDQQDHVTPVYDGVRRDELFV